MAGDIGGFLEEVELVRLRRENPQLKREIDRLRSALEKIVEDGDYTAPERMKQLAREALGSASDAAVKP